MNSSWNTYFYDFTKLLPRKAYIFNVVKIFAVSRHRIGGVGEEGFGDLHGSFITVLALDPVHGTVGLQTLRNFLADRGFMEVETPMLQPLAGGASATPFTTFYEALNSNVYMRIAPELYLKRLLVGGFEKVFELNRSFRNEGVDRRHNPEFTMLEIYQAYSDCRGMMELIETMISTIALKVCGTTKIDHGNGITAKYCSVENVTVKSGDKVHSGEIIGAVGTVNNECADQSHIHLEVLKNKQYISPLEILEDK